MGVETKISHTSIRKATKESITIFCLSSALKEVYNWNWRFNFRVLVPSSKLKTGSSRMRPVIEFATEIIINFKKSILIHQFLLDMWTVLELGYSKYVLFYKPLIPTGKMASAHMHIACKCHRSSFFFKVIRCTRTRCTVWIERVFNTSSASNWHLSSLPQGI